ncbi:hypothetical protein PN36_03005 [Candidatus Thiomargarita nelsonii]|uniref:Uncharacterized protein n=1 Tax=Candidatus Thiomargarita nelsonii TaxID=1003181 RepID=A0A0A6PFS5_9GAMM|nr:hypothetical protein PN36_03005 [Candidatus Thiomargarita nelsonii]
MGFYYFDRKSLWLPLILLVTLMTGYSAEAKDGKTKLTSSEIEQLYAGKTAYFQNGETEYHREDGVTFYKTWEMEIRSGKWFTKENKICYRYYSDYNKSACHKTFKKGEIVTYDGKVLTLKRGDTENLQQAYLQNSLKIREIEQLYAGKTAYFQNGEIEYHREDGVTFYKKKMQIFSGQWFTKENQICYRYYSEYDKVSCQKTFKKGNRVTMSGKLLTLKRGDSEKLQQAYLSYSLELTSSEIEQLYAGKTMYLNGETEYHREDGVTFYNNKKRIILGKWFTEKNHICYRYSDKTVCQKTFKKGDIVTYDGTVITLKRGDTENLQKAYHSQLNEPCPSWKELAPKSTQQELLTLTGAKELDGFLLQPWTSALFNKYYQDQQGVIGSSTLLGWDPAGWRYSQVLTVITLIQPCNR